MTIDKPEKTRELMTTLRAALPFEAELTLPVLAALKSEKNSVVLEPRQPVSRVDYGGDEGGILCHIVPKEEGGAVVVSLTKLRVPRSSPFAARVEDYQKHRIKKLKKQNSW
jgi:hypothetical protein